jgi:Flp pilus assembly protein TadG
MMRSPMPRGRAGNAALLFGLAAVPLAGMIGLAVDYGRAFLLHTRLTTAIDAGALAAGKIITSPATAKQDVAMYVAANLPPGYLGATIAAPSVTIDHVNQRVGVSVSATLPTTFLRVFKVDRLTVNASNLVQRANAGLELALVLDVTGSMASSDRIGQLRAAATSLVNTLFGSSTTAPKNLWVSVTPYAAEINLDPKHTSWLTAGSYTASKWNNQGWRGCVLARRNGEDQTETPPSKAPFTPFLNPATKGKGTNNPWTPGDITDNGTYPQTNDMWGPNLGCPPAVLPLTNDRTAILNKIAAMKPVNRGGTMANQGLQAGWFTLSPRWRGLWGSTTLPLDYRTPDMSKAVVLLTDGANEWFSYAGQDDYTGYQRLGDGLLGTTSPANATTAINNRMAALCANMKAAGIQIYTITLGLAAGSPTRPLYQQCASPGPNHYFDTPSAADLQNIFMTIAGQLSSLRIIQ